LTSEDLDAAARSQERCAELLVRLADVSQPGSGSANVLWVFSRIASTECTWLEGDLVVELFEEDDGLRVRVLEDVGGLRERVLPPVTFRAPLSELVEAIEDIPERLGDLRMEVVSARCVLLLSSLEESPLSAFEISETCLTSSIEFLDRGWEG
jgi:hypothetical protein